MGGGGTETSTSTSGSTNPMVDSTTTKLLTNLQGQVDKGTAVFDQSLYPGMSPTTQNAINKLGIASGNNGGLQQADGWARGVVSSGGYNDALRGAQGGFQSVVDTRGYNPALSSAQTGVEQYLRESQADAPGYAKVRSDTINDTTRDIASSFLTDGRFGSTVMGDAAGEGIASAVGRMDMQNNENRLSRMIGGNQALAGIGQTAMGNAMGANSSIAGLGQTVMGNAGNAASALPGFYQAGLMPYQTELQAGQLLDADALARRQGENDLFRRQSDAGWSTLGQATSILAGNAGASTQQQSQTTPTAPWWQQALGYVAGNAGKAVGMM